MDITINGKAYQISELSTLQQALNIVGLESKGGIAVALNEQIIPRNEWSIQTIQDKDSILIVTATQGG